MNLSSSIKASSCGRTTSAASLCLATSRRSALFLLLSSVTRRPCARRAATSLFCCTDAISAQMATAVRTRSGQFEMGPKRVDAQSKARMRSTISLPPIKNLCCCGWAKAWPGFWMLRLLGECFTFERLTKGRPARVADFFCDVVMSGAPYMPYSQRRSSDYSHRRYSVR